MDGDLPTGDLERTLNRARKSLEAMRASWPAAGSGAAGGAGGGAKKKTARTGGAEPAKATGKACDGQVRAVVVGGRVESIWVDPELKNLPKRFRDYIVEAVNAALDAQDAALAEARALNIDHEALVEQLSQAQEESIRQMAAFKQAIGDVVARLDRAAG